MDNRAGEMEVFVRAVGLGSFSAAGRQLGLSPSAVSKLITRIEDRLGTRLLVRSTRALQLTPEGEVYLERAGRILGEIEEAERVVTSGGSAVPRGPLRVSASVAFGASHIVPHMAEFLALYPGIELDLSLTDSVIDLYQERADVAIRSGKLRDSSLVARKILEIRRVVVASHAYLERHGTPQVPADLAAHNCLRFNFLANRDEWIFRDPETGENFAQRIGGNMLGNNGPTLRRLCLDGSNRQPKFIIPTIADRLAAGASVEGLALESALWCRYCHGVTESGAAIEPNDPNWDRLVRTSKAARDDARAWLAMDDIYGAVGRSPVFEASFARHLKALWADGTANVLTRYLAS